MNDIANDTLGVLRWDEKRNGYLGETRFAPDKSVSVTFVDVDSDNAAAAIARSAQTYTAVRVREPELRQKIADAFLENYNDNWCDEDEGDEALDSTAFQQRVSLTAITFFLDGNAELYYSDGDLFAGHTIIVDANTRGDFQNAHLAG